MTPDQRAKILLCRDKVDLLIPKTSINQPLIEVSAILTEVLEEDDNAPKD